MQSEYKAKDHRSPCIIVITSLLLMPTSLINVVATSLLLIPRSLLTVMVTSLLLSNSYATDLIYTESSIPLTTNTPVLAVIEDINLASPLPIIANRKYAVIFEFENPNVTRKYRGVFGLNSNQCALVHSSSNNSWVSPISNYASYDTFDYFLRVNGNLDVIDFLLANNEASLHDIDLNGTGFGQTFTSNNALLSSFSLYLAAGMSSSNSVNVTMRVYDISDIPISENPSFLFNQETNNPTTSPTYYPSSIPTFQPSSLPTFQPSSLPTFQPINAPAIQPISSPTFQPTSSPTFQPTSSSTFQPTSSPTFQPTSSPTFQPTSSPIRISQTLQPTSSSAYFTPKECDSVKIPIQYINATVICNRSDVFTGIIMDDVVIVGDIVTITVVDLNGQEVKIKNLSSDHQIIFFVPLKNEGIKYMNQFPEDNPPNLTCVWFSNENQIETSGCELLPELGHKNANGTLGRFCQTNHLTSFSLIIRYYETGSSVIHRTTSQYVFIVIFGILAVLATVQMMRALIASRVASMLVRIHFAIIVATLIMNLIYSIFPELKFFPALLILLTSFVTSIELLCYIYLVYIWTIPIFVKKIKIIKNVKLMSQLFLTLIVLINTGIPIIMIFNTNVKTNIVLAKVGSYVMSTFMIVICFGLAFCAFRLRNQLLNVEIAPIQNCNQNRESVMFIVHSLPSRILIGSIGVSTSMIIQSLFWVLSVIPNVFEKNSNGTDDLEVGFGIPAIITFGTLLVLFASGVHEAVRVAANPKNRSSQIMRTNSFRMNYVGDDLTNSTRQQNCIQPSEITPMSPSQQTPAISETPLNSQSVNSHYIFPAPNDVFNLKPPEYIENPSNEVSKNTDTSTIN